MKVAIVTGTSSGIGLYTTLELAKNGYNVFALMRHQSNTKALEEQLVAVSLQHRVEVIKLNMENVQEVQHTIDYIVNKYGQIDLLVNNAGYAQGGLVELMDYELWQQQFQANVWLTINFCKAVAPIMRRQRNGKIINLSSISGKLALPAYAPYAMSKYALEGFSESLRLELISFNVYVVLVEAGSYQTLIWNKGFESLPQNTIADYDRLHKKMVELTKQSAATNRHPRELAIFIYKITKQKKPTLRHIPSIDVKLMLLLKSVVSWTCYELIFTRLILKLKKKH